MTPTQKKRMRLLMIIFATAIIAVLLLLYGMRNNLNHYYSLSEITAMEQQNNPLFTQHKEIRIGGIVQEGSLSREANSLNISFKVSDRQGHHIQVFYTGITPDLFKEGKGVLVTGALNTDGSFSASRILAKHDENYIPPEVQSDMDKKTTDPLNSRDKP